MTVVVARLGYIEGELLGLLAQGHDLKQAAKILKSRGLLGSEGVARFYIGRIHTRLGSDSTAGSVAVAIRTGQMVRPKRIKYSRKEPFDVDSILVLRQIADGATDKRIGGGNRNTGKYRVAKVLRGLGARNRCHAVYLGFRYGFLE